MEKKKEQEEFVEKNRRERAELRHIWNQSVCQRRGREPRMAGGRTEQKERREKREHNELKIRADMEEEECGE